MSTGYYASVMDGRRRGLLLGPFTTHNEASEQVDQARQLARQADPRAAFYAYGTARVESVRLPLGRLNALAVAS